VYGAAKAGVKLLTEGLYAELMDTDVGVSVVMPGAVETSITENSGVDAPVDPDEVDTSRFPTTAPDDAARTIVDGIEKDRLHILVGRDAKLMNAANRLAPKQSTHLIQRQMKDLLPS
jgi:short-subunit dehydrogenase